MDDSLRVLALFAHPDDAEFLCAGTLALLSDRQAEIHIVTMTAGDCGSASLSPAQTARLRKREAAQSARLVGGVYHCLNEKDLAFFYDKRRMQKVMELVREVRPTLVLTHSPIDYMADHEVTSRLCQTACFGAMAKNYQTGARHPARPLVAVPHLYYAAPFGDRDILGTPVRCGIFVNIAKALATKERMLASHKSQESWLSLQQGVAGLVSIMRQTSAKAGECCGCRWAEGFRQHLGQGFPQSNLLQDLLGGLVRFRSQSISRSTHAAARRAKQLGAPDQATARGCTRPVS